MDISLRSRSPVVGTLAAVLLLALVTGASNHAPPRGDSAGQQVAAGGPPTAGGRAALRVAAPTGSPVTSTSVVAGVPAVGAFGESTTTTTTSSGGTASPGSSDGTGAATAADGTEAEDDPGADADPGPYGVTATPGVRETTAPPDPDPDPVPVDTAPVETVPPSPSLTRQPGVEQEVLALTNADRANAGVAGIARDGCVDAEASAWARQMADAGVMAHSAGGEASVQGCRGDGAYWGDNIGHWQPCSASSMQDWWMNSPSHRPHILDPVYDVVGIGVWSDPAGRCWFQVFFGS